ncbi:MAG: thiamine-phosphate kinase [Gemmatimonadota bacterium]
MTAPRPPRVQGVEFELISLLIEAAGASPEIVRSSGGRILVPPGDDAGVIRLAPEMSLVVSTDLSVEDVHFRRAWSTWEVFGYRAVATALSDLAAMGAQPIGALVSVALPPELSSEVVVSLGHGLGECLRAHGACLVGGDLSRSPGPAVLDVTVLGGVEVPVTRAGARPGDELWVTGQLGAAAEAVFELRSGLEPAPEVRRALERPVPRVAEARWLAARLDIHAMIDVSDGLAGDARHLATASGVRVTVRLAALPLAPCLDGYAGREVALRLGLAGGEDYELLFAAAPGAVEAWHRAFEAEFELPLTQIGDVTAGHGMRWVSEDGSDAEIGLAGYDHFAPPVGKNPE